MRSKVRTSLGIRQSTFLVGNVARFRAQKNHAFLIKVFAEIKKKNKDSKLLLVGDGELMGKTRDELKSLGIEDDVIFTGSRSDVADLLQAMDVFILPSIHEGLPVSIIEAQAAGLPCIISDGVPIECKKTSLVVQLKQSESPVEWANQVLNMRSIPRKNTYQEISKAGYDVNLEAKKVEQFYLDCYMYQNQKEKILWQR